MVHKPSPTHNFLSTIVFLWAIKIYCIFLIAILALTCMVLTKTPLLAKMEKNSSCNKNIDELSQQFQALQETLDESNFSLSLAKTNRIFWTFTKLRNRSMLCENWPDLLETHKSLHQSSSKTSFFFFF